MKTNAIIRIVLWSLVLLLLLAVLGGLLGLRAYHSSFRSLTAPPMSYEPGQEPPIATDPVLTLDPSQVRSLDIQWAAGDITILPADVESITVSETAVSREDYALVYQIREGELSIEFCRDKTFLRIGIGTSDSLTKDLLIQVPRDWECRSLEIDAAAANVEVADLTIREVDFDGASGECFFTDCVLGSLDLDTASGDVEFRGSLEELDCDAASASFTGIFTNVPRRLDLDSMSGSLDLTLPAECGFSVEMEGLSMKFSSDFATTSQNGRHVYGDGSCRITVDGLSGDVYIRKGE